MRKNPFDREEVTSENIMKKGQGSNKNCEMFLAPDFYLHLNLARHQLGKRTIAGVDKPYVSEQKKNEFELFGCKSALLNQVY
jgi:hypothetical protein